MKLENKTDNLKSIDPKTNTTFYDDFMALFFLTCYLLIDFLPHFESIEIIITQFFYLSIVNISVLLYLFCNKKTSFINFKLFSREGLALKLYLVFIILCGCSMFTTKNLSLSIISFSQLLIVAVMIINLVLLFRDKSYLLNKIALLIGFSIIIQAILQFNSTLKSFETISIALSSLKGNTGNINVFSASFNVKIPFLIIGILHFKDWRKYFLIIALFLSSLIVLLTGSRSAYLGLFFEILIFVIIYFKIYFISKKSFKEITYLLLPIMFSVIITSLVFKNTESSGRYESVTGRIGQIGDTNEASAAARLNYWHNASQMIAKDPITGIGIGNWKLESIPYEKSIIDDALISSHTHNDFFEITTETGIINGTIYLSLFILIFLINIKRIFTKNKTNKKQALFVILLLTGYSIDAFFNFPLYRPTMQLGFAFILLFTYLNTDINDIKDVIHPWSKKILVLVCLTSVFSLFISYHDLLGGQLEYKIKYSKNSITSEEILHKYPLISEIGIYGEPFYQHIAIALYNKEDFITSEKYFNLSKKINPYMGVADWYLYKIEKLKGNNEKAYKHIKFAFYSRPRTLNFYLDGLRMASVFKDTTEIFKIHNLFNKYREMPTNWKNTAAALQLANYDSLKINAFIKQGIKKYPGDTTLILKRKQNINPSNKQNSSNKSLDIAPKTINYMIEAKKMGDAKQFDKAIELYKKELTLNPEKKVIYQDIAVCYFSLNKSETAISYLLKIVNEPTLNDGKTEYLLSGCYYKIQDKINSCKYLNLASNKNFPGSKELLNQICK